MPTHPRVISLIASATEIVCALGLGDRLVGRSHECDFPAEVGGLPALTAPRFSTEGASAEIDARVRQLVRDGLAVYSVDAEALRALEPDVILTQDQCNVCAASLADVEAATCAWTGRPVRIVSLRPDCLADAYADVRRVADALGAPGAGDALVQAMRSRIAAVGARVAGVSRLRASASPEPRVAFIEWVEPPMAGGNWMPELIEAAGAMSLLGTAGRRSEWMRWPDLLAADPDAIVVAPCGYDLARCLAERPLLEAKPGWSGIAAVRAARVFLAERQRLLQPPRPAPCRHRGAAGGDAAPRCGEPRARRDGVGQDRITSSLSALGCSARLDARGSLRERTRGTHR
jgi:iron complex transport system substrate-binding protein